MSKKIFVGNLPYSATGEQLTELFSKFGQVDSVYIPVDKERGRPSGIAFVEFNVDAHALKAMAEMQGTEIGGRKIVIEEARPKTDRGARDSHSPKRDRPSGSGGRSGQDE